jgi:hypothetical protein
VSARIERVTASAYSIPTDAPEADGTIEWNATGLVIAEVAAAGCQGMGYSYADASARSLIPKVLSNAVKGLDAMDKPAAWIEIKAAGRHVGQAGGE